MSATYRPRWLGATLALLMLVLGFSTVAVGASAPAQAHAGSSFEQCFPVTDSSGQVIHWICVPIPVNNHPCPPCQPFAIGFDHLINPADLWYVEDLANGLGLLGEASQTADPRVAARIREAAQTSFLASADRLGAAQIQLGEVGYVDRRNQVIEPDPEPWLEAAGADLVSGLTLMQAALASSDPARLVTQAMQRFDAAFHSLSHH